MTALLVHSAIRPAPVNDILRSTSSAMHSDSILHLQLLGERLTNVAIGLPFFRGVSSPVFQVCAYTQSLNNWQVVTTSERVENSLSPSWLPLKIRCDALCQCDMEQPIQIQVYDQSAQGEPLVPMGNFDTTVQELLRRQTGGVNENAFKFSLMQEGETVGAVVVVTAMIEIEEPQHGVESRLVIGNTAESSPQGGPETGNRNGPRGMVTDALFKRASETADDEKPEGDGASIEDTNQEAKVGTSSCNYVEEWKQTLNTRTQHSQRSIQQKRRGSIIRASEKETVDQRHPDDKLRLILRGTDLVEMPVGIGQDVAVSRCCRISRFRPGQGGTLFQNVFTSKVVPNNRSPVWEEWVLSLDEICGRNRDRPVLLTLWEDRDSTQTAQLGGRATRMGSCQTTVTELLKKKPMVLTQRGRHMGKLFVVEAAILEDNDTSEAAVPVPNWLAHTLDAASGLMAHGWAENADIGSPPRVEEEENGRKENTGTSMRQFAKTLQAVEDTLTELDDDDDVDGGAAAHDNDLSNESSGAEDVADVISIAEECMQRGDKEHTAGLMELTQMLAPRKSLTKSPKKSLATRSERILAGMPAWDLGGDSVMSEEDPPIVVEAAALDKVGQAEHMGPATKEETGIANASQQECCDVHREIIGVSIEESKRSEEPNLDLTGVAEPQNHPVAASKAVCSKKRRRRKAAKKRVPKTRNAMQRLLMDNLKIVPETHTPEEKVMKAIDREENEMGTFDVDSINTEYLETKAFHGPKLGFDNSDPSQSRNHDGGINAARRRSRLIPQRSSCSAYTTIEVSRARARSMEAGAGPGQSTPSITESWQHGHICSEDLGLALTAKFAADAMRKRGVEAEDQVDFYEPPALSPEHKLDGEALFVAGYFPDSSFPPQDTPKADEGGFFQCNPRKIKRRGSLTSGYTMMKEGSNSAVKDRVKMVKVAVGKPGLQKDKHDSTHLSPQPNRGGDPRQDEDADLHGTFPTPPRKRNPKDGSKGGMRRPPGRRDSTGGAAIKAVVNQKNLPPLCHHHRTQTLHLLHLRPSSRPTNPSRHPRPSHRQHHQSRPDP